MNLDLKSDKLSYFKPVFKGRFVKEETIEVIVPDALPDILRIIDTDGTPFLRGKDTEMGRVAVSGVAEMTVLYVPESGGGVRRLPVSIPFAANGEGVDITSDCLITANLTLTGADSRTVNPRKVVVRAEVAVEAMCFVPVSLYGTAARDTEDVYFRSESHTLRLPAAVNEKTFIFTDELRLPASAPAMGEILESETVLSLESVKSVGSKAVLNGNAQTTVLYEVRGSAALHKETFTTSFSQVVETDAAGECVDFDVILASTGVYLNRGYGDDAGNETLSLEVHAVAQCVPYTDMTFGCLTDAYSTKYPLELTRERCEFECLTGSETVPVTLLASLPVAGKAESVPEIRVREVSASLLESGGKCAYVGMLHVSCVYQDANGELLSASRKTELEQEIKNTEGDVTISLRQAGEAFVSQGEDSIDLRIPMELMVKREQRKLVERIEAIAYDEEASLDLSGQPNLIVTRAGNGDLWEMAKKHYSTVALIREANGIGEDEVFDRGDVLLIPRCG